MDISNCYLSKKEIMNRIPDIWNIEDKEYKNRIQFNMQNTSNHITINYFDSNTYLFVPMVENNTENGFNAKNDTKNQETFNTLDGAIEHAIYLINKWDDVYY